MIRRVPSSLARLGLLCLLIVVIGMFRPRLSVDAARWVVLGSGLLVLVAALAFSAVTRRTVSRNRLAAGGYRIADGIFDVVRRTGLPFLALAFFLFWTFVYLGLWWANQDSFHGLGDTESPRFADFFYYAVMTAFTSPPEGIAPLTRGARSATMIELLTGLALLTTYVGSLFEWRRERSRSERAHDGPPDG